MSSHTDLANAIRALSIDAVQQANSGHPGMPMGMADIATVLWRQFLKHNPQNPHWINRDRFVLSNGHGSMLLYSLLHLSGYDLSIDDLKDFRQLESKTPGHPEFGHTPGIETTTGPLGQGIANAVGMAIAEKLLAAEFNADDNAIIDHYTYVFLGDGCLMEGISHEVCSLAGTLQLNKLIAFYDDNGISIDGKIDGWFNDNTALRFQAYGWHVVDNIDGHDPQAIEQAIQAAQAEQQRPTIIICKTHIGFGSPRLQDSEKSHGAPLGQDEIAATKKALNWPHEAFVVPEKIYQDWQTTERGNDLENSWQHQFDRYAEQSPDKAATLLRRLAGDLPKSFESVSEALIQNLNNSEQSDATRKLSQKCIESFATILPELLGGSADLTGSNNTNWSNAKALKPGESAGNYLNYGVREFGMSAIMNGIALHGGFIPFGGTFLVFSDYARNAVRLSAMMQQRVIYIYSHDSIGLGEDGPTHQPIEHITMLRATPGLDVWRPADGVETAVAWQESLLQEGPSCLLLSRQTLPYQQRNESQLSEVAKGGYVLKDCEGEAEVILMATGSELQLATEAFEQLTQTGTKVRVVSIPCMELFLRQSPDYQQHVLPASVTKRVAIEAGSPECWYRFTGLNGKVIGISEYGRSAPFKEIYQTLGITTDAIVTAVKELQFV
jgi:transketolase